ncbi:PIN domain-containing protein [Galbitalea sp. SE-J8]|uniref:TA system VapC family ribonuclease toxin n=1 Tax=Galbitalea sp. SE-J8 TaxID=3054952 RepID=UPI00259D30BE|nr:TA system VapC family ribonuclease toxin [Galbitalea sp. SE-J8]MDM4761571.1 PIN domain-containing protein [Galbitalea sp. SE-J8]
MKLVDANVLLYAIDESATHHGAARQWLDRSITSGETVGMPWVSLLAFIRIATHPNIYEHPLRVDQALDVADAWLARPNVVTLDPDARHLIRMRQALAATGRGGNLVNDAHLAALALQFDAVVGTFDSDFGRFPGVRWERPDS